MSEGHDPYGPLRAKVLAWVAEHGHTLYYCQAREADEGVYVVMQSEPLASMATSVQLVRPLTLPDGLGVGESYISAAEVRVSGALTPAMAPLLRLIVEALEDERTGRAGGDRGRAATEGAATVQPADGACDHTGENTGG